MISRFSNFVTSAFNVIATLTEDEPLTSIDFFLLRYPEHVSALEGNETLSFCLKEANLMTESPGALLVLGAFLGRAESYVQRSSRLSEIPLVCFAALGGQLELVSWLVTVGGWDLQKKDEQGNCVLDYALLNKQKSMISWLEDKPGFGKAKAVSKLLSMDREILNEERDHKVIRLITKALSEPDLIEISERSEELEQLFERSLLLILSSVKEMGLLENQIQNLKYFTALERALLKIVRVVHFTCLQNIEVSPLDLLDEMIHFAHIKYSAPGRVLGEGSFAMVSKIYHIIEARHYAIKIPKPVDDEDEIAIQNEADLLEYIKEHDPVHSIALKIDLIQWNHRKALIMELHGVSLLEIVHKTTHMSSLSIIRKIAGQLIGAFAFLEKVGVVHSDVKPANILLRLGVEDQVVLSDFGSGFRLPLDKKTREYLFDRTCQTIWYRSPECALKTMNSLNYGHGVDMWSLGCILIELFRKKVLFPAEEVGNLYMYQQMRLGPYPENLLLQKKVPLGILYQKVPERSIASIITADFDEKHLGEIASARDLEELKRFIDLVEQMLILDPISRISVLKASQHEFFQL